VGLIIYLGNGDGTFQAVAQYAASGLFDPPFSIPSIIAADFNHDGKLDLAVTNGGNQMVSVFIGNGDGTFRGPAPYPTGLSVTTTLAAADFNGDGKVDLAVRWSVWCLDTSRERRRYFWVPHRHRELRRRSTSVCG